MGLTPCHAHQTVLYAHRTTPTTYLTIELQHCQLQLPSTSVTFTDNINRTSHILPYLRYFIVNIPELGV